MWQGSNSAERSSQRLSAARVVPQRTKVVQIKDHNDDEVHIAWLKKEYQDADDEGLPPCPWQIYVLNAAKETVAEVQNKEFASQLVEWIEMMLGRAADAEGVEAHYEVYTRSFNDYLACVAHQRREIAHRNRSSIWPHLISSYAAARYSDEYDPEYPAQTHEYGGFALVVDRDNWQMEGITALVFDRSQFDPQKFRGGIPYGLENVIAAKPLRTKQHVQQEMIEAWRLAGGHWMQTGLTRRNQGAQSPASYPAQDPVAHEDAADSDNDDQGDASVNGQHSLEDNLSEMEVDQDDEVHPLEFDTCDLWKEASEFPYYKRAQYEDTTGWLVTSVWDTRNSKARPTFAFTLYLSARGMSFVPQGYFSCLNRGRLRNVPWALDIIYDLPDIGSAYRHYTAEARQRSPARSRSRAKAVQLILNKIALPLPEELLVHIHNILVPPYVTGYASLPERRFRDVFMYLDAEAVKRGPHMVYSNPVALNRYDCQDLEVWRFAVNHLQHWPLVTDELHTMWSICAPRAELSAMEGHYFKMTFSISYSRTYDETVDYVAPPPHVRMTLALVGHRPVTIHKICHDFFEDALILDDPKAALTGIVADEWLSREQRAQTWSTDPAFASSIDEIGSYVYRGLDRLETFMPGQEVDMTDSLLLLGLHKWWHTRRAEGLLGLGQTHHIHVNDDLHFKRWTFGTTGGLEGPFNLPPIPVRIEGQKEFVVDLRESTT